MEQGAQRPQEAARILQQLFRGQQHHDDQGALGQVLGLVRRAVQPVPATLLRVAPLVAAVVFEVVCAVFVIPSQGRETRAKGSEHSKAFHWG